MKRVINKKISLLVSLIFLYFLVSCGETDNSVFDNTPLFNNCFIINDDLASNRKVKKTYIRNNYGRLESQHEISKTTDTIINSNSYFYNENDILKNEYIIKGQDTVVADYIYQIDRLDKSFYQFVDGIKSSKHKKITIHFTAEKFITLIKFYNVVDDVLYNYNEIRFLYDADNFLSSKAFYSNNNLDSTFYYSDYDTNNYFLDNMFNDYYRLRTFTSNPKTLIREYTNKTNDTLIYYYKYDDNFNLINRALDSNNLNNKYLYSYICY